MGKRQKGKKKQFYKTQNISCQKCVEYQSETSKKFWPAKKVHILCEMLGCQIK